MIGFSPIDLTQCYKAPECVGCVGRVGRVGYVCHPMSETLQD